MKDLLLLELRDKSAEIRAVTDEEEYNKGIHALAEAILRVEKLSNIARKEGLLALEEQADELDAENSDRYLKKMIMLIVDGIDRELVEDITISRYFAEGLTDFDAIKYLVYLEGILSMQEGDNPHVIVEKLLAMVPEAVEKVYWDKDEEAFIEAPHMEKGFDVSELESLYEGEVAVGTDSPDYYLFKIADLALSSLDERSMQRLLRDVQNSDLTVAMKGLSGKARHNILDNVSTRLAVMLAEDMRFMGPVRLVDVRDAIIKIYSIMIKLLNANCIATKDKEALFFFHKIIKVSRSEEARKAEKEVDGGLYELLKQYEAGKYKLIDTNGETS